MSAIGLREIAAATRVLASGNLSRYQTTRTSQVRVFEEELATSMGVRHALAVNSGTSALICALVGAGIGPGDEVLVPGYTWVSTAAAPLAVGAVPVLVEIDESLTIDPVDIELKITPATKAIIPVHMANMVCNMDAIMTIARRHGLIVIEDACQAAGLTYRGRQVGSIGDAGAFSFNQHKNMTSGEGGAILTNDDRIYSRAAMYHDVGHFIREERFESEEPLFVGVNCRMPELSAAILRPQLKRLPRTVSTLKSRRRFALNELRRSPTTGWSLNRHNDIRNAVGLSVRFSDEADAVAFGGRRGVTRLIDSGRHVYQNWEPIIGRRSSHPKMNPYAWASSEVGFQPDSLPKTLEILRHTCTINLLPELPSVAFKFLAKRMLR